MIGIPMRHYHITIEPEGKKIKGLAGETIKEALERSGYFFPNNCGGKGRCLSCRIEYLDNIPPLTELESVYFSDNSNYRMACQQRLTEDIHISVSGFTVFENSKLIDDLVLKGGGNGYGIAVDLGTTLVAIYIVDLSKRKLIAQCSFLNPQIRYGGDVMSRLDFAKQETNRATLTNLTHKRIREVIRRSLSQHVIERGEVSRMFVVGNSAMTHLWLGMSGEGLERAPFRSPLEKKNELSFDAKLVGLTGKCKASVSPILAGYVGGDTVAAILASDLDRKPGKRLLIDFGTNGEVVLSTNGKLTATSTAAGPAFEGVGMRCGMPAISGAIDGFNSDGKPHVIGSEIPIGFCGSGYISALRMLLEQGILNPSGLLERNSDDNREWSPMLSGVPVITQDDIRQFQLAKGAVAAGIEILCGRAEIHPPFSSPPTSRGGKNINNLDEIILTGSFGSRIDPQAAINIGLIPDIPVDRITFIDNGAGRGAVLCLSDDHCRKRAINLQKTVKVINLGEMPDFQDRFVENMTFRKL